MFAFTSLFCLLLLFSDVCRGNNFSIFHTDVGVARNGTIVYNPSGAWLSNETVFDGTQDISFGKDIMGGIIPPGQITPNITLTFDGSATAVYVFAVLNNSDFQSYLFSIDGFIDSNTADYGTTSGATGIVVDFPFYVNTNVPAISSQHTLVIIDQSANMEFRSIIYTTLDSDSVSSFDTLHPPPSTTPSTPVGVTSTSSPVLSPSAADITEGQSSSHNITDAIIGGTVGALSVFISISVVLLYRRRRRQLSRENGIAELGSPMTTVVSPNLPSALFVSVGHTAMSEASVTSEGPSRSAPTGSGLTLSPLSPHARNETQTSISDTLLEASLLGISSSADKASSTRGSRVSSHVADAHPNASYSEVQSRSWERATRQERVQEIQRMHLQLNAMERSMSDDSGGRRAESEIEVLRAYVAQLEAQLYGPWMTPGDGEPPPEY